jgi:hypothetical protein
VASPENGLSDDTIIAKKGQLDQITYYFEHADQEYETYAVLVLAYNLRLMLTTAQAATRLARNANDSSGKENIVAVLTKAIAALQAWPAGYVIARAKHVSVEMEMKRQGPTDWLGHVSIISPYLRHSFSHCSRPSTHSSGGGRTLRLGDRVSQD